MATKVQIILDGQDNASDDIKRVGDSLGRLNNTPMSGITQNLTNIGKIVGGTLVAGVGLLGAGFTAFAANGIQSAASLEAQMSGIAAVLQKTTAEVEPLQGLIQDLALNPELTVNTQQAADAIQMLARNGLDMAQIMDGAALSVVALANATGGEFATSADIMTDAMAQFNIEAGQLETVVDGITGVVNNSKLTVDDFGLALAQAGGVAASSGVSFDDFSTTIAAISPLFASGSDAGTSFKTMLQRLTAPTDEASALMAELGINVYDANGQLLSMSEIAGQLNQALYGVSEVTTEVGGRTTEQNILLQEARKSYDSAQKAIRRYENGLSGASLTEEQRAKKIAELNAQMVNAENIITELDSVQGELVTTTKQLTEAERSRALTIIFGSDASRAAAGLASMTAAEFEALAGQVNLTGQAFNAASTRVDNLQGDLDIFGGIIESIGIQFGQSLLPHLRTFVQLGIDIAETYGGTIASGLSDFVGAFSNLIDRIVEGEEPLTIANLAIKEFGRVFGMSTQDIRDARQSLADMLDILTPLYDQIVLVTQPVVDFVTENVKLQDVMVALGITLAAVVIPALASIAAGVLPLVATFAALVAGVALLRTAWEENFLGIQDIVGEATGYISESFTTLKEMFDSGDYEGMFDFVVEQVTALGERVGEALSEFLTAVTTWFGEQDWASVGAHMVDAIIAYYQTVFAVGGAVVGAIGMFHTAVSTWFAEQDWAATAEALVTGITDYLSGAEMQIRFALKQWWAVFLDWVETTDWEKVAKDATIAIVDGLIAFGTGAAGLAIAVTAWYNTTTQEIQDKDWGQIAQDIVDMIIEVANPAFLLGIGPVVVGWLADTLAEVTGIDFGSIGSAIIDGAVAGLAESGGRLVEAAKAIANNAFWGALAELGVPAGWLPGSGAPDGTGAAGDTPPATTGDVGGNRSSRLAGQIADRLATEITQNFYVNTRTFSTRREGISALAQLGGI